MNTVLLIPLLNISIHPSFLHSLHSHSFIPPLLNLSPNFFIPNLPSIYPTRNSTLTYEKSPFFSYFVQTKLRGTCTFRNYGFLYRFISIFKSCTYARINCKNSRKFKICRKKYCNIKMRKTSGKSVTYKYRIIQFCNSI